jgi:hypothetical protein
MSAAKSYDEIIDFIAAGTTPEALVAAHHDHGKSTGASTHPAWQLT